MLMDFSSMVVSGDVVAWSIVVGEAIFVRASGLSLRGSFLGISSIVGRVSCVTGTILVSGVSATVVVVLAVCIGD